MGSALFKMEDSEIPFSESFAPEHAIIRFQGRGMITYTLEELRQKRKEALVGSEQAILKHRTTYQALKHLLHDINSGPVDISDYYRTAKRLVEMLKEMSEGVDRTIFHLFATQIDPAKGGDARWFRLACLDLAEHVKDIERWRAAKTGLRVVK